MPATKTLLTWEFDPIEIDPAKYYYLQLDSPGNGESFTYYGNNSDVYAGGRAYNANTGAASSLADLYFVISGGAASLPDVIEFTNPIDEEEKPADFTFWEFDYTLSNPTSSIDIYYNVFVEYIASSTSSTFRSLGNYLSATGQDSGSFSVFKGTLLPPDTYTATSTLFSVDLNDCQNPPSEFEACNNFDQYASTTLATDNITFSVAGFLSYFDPYNSTSTINNLSATCDASSNFFSESLCKMFITLFIPSQDSLEQFDGIGELIQEKPPVGYFSEFKTALTNYASGTLASAEFSFDEEVGNFTPISTLRTAFGWIFWLVFGFWVFHRLRHFDFHT